MHTRLLFDLSAAFLALAGVGITFLPQELLAYAGAPVAGPPVLIAQLLGALYMGGAVLNRMARGLTAGGIYGRPIAMANLAHFAIGAIALVKHGLAGGLATDVAVLAAVYVTFAAWFGVVVFTHPAPRPDAAG